mmetsp:Transcript_49934/g.139830  ORF Transcript_49934/g.139830 Transcript_49934/m.139830 type:complete len:203 (+) Transcript_49934:266-874(+)
MYSITCSWSFWWAARNSVISASCFRCSRANSASSSCRRTSMACDFCSSSDNFDFISCSFVISSSCALKQSCNCSSSRCSSSAASRESCNRRSFHSSASAVFASRTRRKASRSSRAFCVLTRRVAARSFSAWYSSKSAKRLDNPSSMRASSLTRAASARLLSIFPSTAAFVSWYWRFKSWTSFSKPSGLSAIWAWRLRKNSRC